MSAVLDGVLRVVGYTWERLKEPSTIKGLIMICAAYGWWGLDNSSKGEAIAQGGLLLIGMINAGLPQRTLYRKPSDEQPPTV